LAPREFVFLAIASIPMVAGVRSAARSRGHLPVAAM
jgi:hypothetical protein